MDDCQNKLSAAESACFASAYAECEASAAIQCGKAKFWQSSIDLQLAHAALQHSKAAYRHGVASVPSLDPHSGCSSWVGSQPSEAVIDAAQRVLVAPQPCEEVDDQSLYEDLEMDDFISQIAIPSPSTYSHTSSPQAGETDHGSPPVFSSDSD